MASATCEIRFGVLTSAAPGTTNSVSCEIKAGFPVSATPTAWAGNEGSRNVSDWLPRIDEKPIDPRTNCFTPRWHNFFRELGNRLGGVQGPSITQIVNVVQETQVQVAENTAYTDSAVAYTASVAAAQAATAQVAQTNGLSGAGSIPPTGSPPNRPNYQVQ